MRKITPRQYAASLYETVKNLAEQDLSKALQNFVKLLVKNKALAKTNKILAALSDYADQEEGILSLTIKTASQLKNEQKKEIISSLENFFKKQIRLEEKIDGRLIGGAVLEYQNLVIDGSIKKKLDLLKKSIIK